MKRFEIIEQFDECNKVVLSTNSFEEAVRRIMQQLNASGTICVGDIEL